MMGLLVKRLGFNHSLWYFFRRGVKAADGAQAIGLVEFALGLASPNTHCTCNTLYP